MSDTSHVLTLKDLRALSNQEKSSEHKNRESVNDTS